MKFDYIIGNPPYQRPKLKTERVRDSNGSSDLFYSILQKHYTRFNRQMIMLTPAKIASKKILKRYGLKKFTFEGDVFDLGLEIGNWLLEKGYKGKIYVKDTKSNTFYTKDDLPLFPESKRKVFELYNKSKQRIKERVQKEGHLGRMEPGEKKSLKINKDDLYKYSVTVSLDGVNNKKRIMYSKEEFLEHRYKKIVIPMSQKIFYKTVVITDEVHTNLFYGIDIRGYTKDEINNVMMYLNSVEVQVYSEFVAKSIGSLRYWFIPLGAKKKMSKDEIIESLGFTKEEWEEVLSLEVLQSHIKMAEESYKIFTDL